MVICSILSPHASFSSSPRGKRRAKQEARPAAKRGGERSRAGGAARLARTPGTKTRQEETPALGPRAHPRSQAGSALGIPAGPGRHSPPLRSLAPPGPPGAALSTPQTAVVAPEPAGPAQAGAELLRRRRCGDRRFASNGPLQPPGWLPVAGGETPLWAERAAGRSCGRRRGWGCPETASRETSPGPRGARSGLGRAHQQTEIRGSRGKGFFLTDVERSKEVPGASPMGTAVPWSERPPHTCRELPGAGPRCALGLRLEPLDSFSSAAT